MGANGERFLTVLAVAASGVLLCLLGGFAFLHYARKLTRGKAHSSGVVTRVSSSAQWISALMGSYLIPLLALLGEGLAPFYFVAITIAIAFTFMLAACIPPTLFLLFAGYRFYDVSLSSGVDYRLISKNKSIRNANDVGYTVRLFNGHYWLLEVEN